MRRHPPKERPLPSNHARSRIVDTSSGRAIAARGQPRCTSPGTRMQPGGTSVDFARHEKTGERGTIGTGSAIAQQGKEPTLSRCELFGVDLNSVLLGGRTEVTIPLFLCACQGRVWHEYRRRKYSSWDRRRAGGTGYYLIWSDPSTAANLWGCFCCCCCFFRLSGTGPAAVGAGLSDD